MNLILKCLTSTMKKFITYEKGQSYSIFSRIHCILYTLYVYVGITVYNPLYHVWFEK